MTSLNNDPLASLILYNSRRDRRSELARWVLSQGAASDPGGPPWPITSAHCREAEVQLAAMEALGIEIISGARLAQAWGRVKGVPAFLFVRGDRDLVLERGVGMVGARRGVRSLGWVYDLARRCGEEGVPVVSGGAVGVDSAAHLGALDAGGRTVAYLGVAADRLYPSRNRELFRALLDGGGALASEHGPGVATRAYEHANRNRLIVGQSRAVVVAEAGVKSGTLGTAQWAGRLGVDVWFPPDRVGGERSGIDALRAAGKGRVLDDPQELLCG
jgi:DNA processing protein